MDVSCLESCLMADCGTCPEEPCGTSTSGLVLQLTTISVKEENAFGSSALTLKTRTRNANIRGLSLNVIAPEFYLDVRQAT
jgi:hypothetical protein